MLKAYHQFFLYDKDNKLIKKSRKRKSKSFVKQFIQNLYCFISDIGLTSSVKDTSANLRTCQVSIRTFLSSHPGGTFWFGQGEPQYYWEYTWPTYSDTIGIIVGTSNQAVAITDYSLISPIAHGTSIGTLEYLNCGVTTPIINAGTNTATFTVNRLFRNSSGFTISIQEIALYGYNTYIPSTTYGYPTCMLRDIVSPAFDIANGEYLKATYTFSITA